MTIGIVVLFNEILIEVNIFAVNNTWALKSATFMKTIIRRYFVVGLMISERNEENEL